MSNLIYGNTASLSVCQLCAIPKDKIQSTHLDMANIFFRDVFGNDTAPRVMSGIIALSLFGNIVVMTFTASRGPFAQKMLKKLPSKQD